VNLHHSKAALTALLLRLADGGADLVLIQEPWVVGGMVAGLGTKDFKLLLDPKEGKIRTCILAKRHLSIFLLHNYSNGDITVASLELPVATIRVASAYMAFEKEDPPDELVRTLVKDSEALKLGLAATQTLTTLSGEAQQATTGVSLFLTSSLAQIYFYATGVIPPPLSQKIAKQSLTLPWCQVIC